MEMVGSTGTDVKRVFTSYEKMHSPCSNWMVFMFQVLGVPDVVGRVAYQWPQGSSQLLGNTISDHIPTGYNGPKGVPCLCV